MLKSARETRENLRQAWHDLFGFSLALGRRVFDDRLTQTAGSLTYTTLLAAVPLATVALALASAFPVFDRAVSALQDYIIGHFLPDTAGIDQFVEQLSDFSERARQLTAIGLGALAVTAVMLMLTIDDVMNRIFRVERKRPLMQRLATYWAVLTLGPALIGGSLSMTSALVVSSLGMLQLDWLAELVLRFTPFVLTWAALSLVYLLVPNRRVPLAHAATGAFVAGAVFELAKRGFALYVSRFPTYTIIYGTFATVLLFLVWLYLSWLIALVGAAFTAMLGAFRHGRFDERGEPLARERRPA
ncbi:MAG: YihY family inner membrane protein [Betaproteobacteria bacterium]|nr:YihY family inner membrane protein [Betaproteobacteria bacterium]